MADDVKKIEHLEDCTPDAQNANKGTVRGLAMVEDSLRHYGAGRSILADRNGVILAGNKTHQAATEMGLPVRVVQTDGRELVVVQRTDLDLAKDRHAKELALADNRASEVGLAWDLPVLIELRDTGVDLGAFFDSDELTAMAIGTLADSSADDAGTGGGKAVTCPHCGASFTPS